MRYLAIVQARMGSSRLPGKVLKDLLGRPMLLRQIDRIKNSRLLDDVVVATTMATSDLPIVKLCSNNDIRVFAGSENDVLDRFWQVAKILKPDYVVRITADCPCFDPFLLDEAIMSMDPSADYLGMMSETFPDGLDLEVIRSSALQRSWRESRLKSQREHVTQYIVKNPDKFVCQDFSSRLGFHGNERWTVDEPEDFELIKAIYQHFYDGDRLCMFTYGDILEFLDENPQLRRLNNKIARNEGLTKSLQEDSVVDLRNE